jgi:hypothetical protein
VRRACSPQTRQGPSMASAKCAPRSAHRPSPSSEMGSLHPHWRVGWSTRPKPRCSAGVCPRCSGAAVKAPESSQRMCFCPHCGLRWSAGIERAATLVEGFLDLAKTHIELPHMLPCGGVQVRDCATCGGQHFIPLDGVTIPVPLGIGEIVGLRCVVCLKPKHIILL